MTLSTSLKKNVSNTKIHLKKGFRNTSVSVWWCCCCWIPSSQSPPHWHRAVLFKKAFLSLEFPSQTFASTIEEFKDGLACLWKSWPQWSPLAWVQPQFVGVGIFGATSHVCPPWYTALLRWCTTALSLWTTKDELDWCWVGCWCDHRGELWGDPRWKWPPLECFLEPLTESWRPLLPCHLHSRYPVLSSCSSACRSHTCTTATTTTSVSTACRWSF